MDSPPAKPGLYTRLIILDFKGNKAARDLQRSVFVSYIIREPHIGNIVAGLHYACRNTAIFSSLMKFGEIPTSM